MHILDRLILHTPPEVSGELRAWRMPEFSASDPEAARLALALLRPSDMILSAISRDVPSFLRSYGQEDTPELRAAWTEPLAPWSAGASVRLEPAKSLFYIQWTAENEDGSESVNRLEAATLTQELALAQFHTGLSDQHVPFIAGLITREQATQSLALLLSRMEAVLMSLDHLGIELQTDLPWPELVRLAFAGAQYHVPEVLHMQHEALRDLYAREFTSFE